MENVIQTHSLSKSFGNVHALKSIDLAVPKNSIFGFLGPNGAGKTTAIKILLGLIRPSRGSATIFGVDLQRDGVRIRERIGYLPQHPHFIEYMTARENLEFAARFFFSGPRAAIRKRCQEMLELVGLQDKARRPIKGFSGGEKQRLGIALAQVNYPDLLILDEPASALDPIGRHEVLEVMERLRKYTTIFYSTHILDDVQRVSDQAAILNRGALVAQGPIDQLLNRKDGTTYSITVRGDPQILHDSLPAIPWVAHAWPSHLNGTTQWQVQVADNDEAEAGLLRRVLANKQVTVTAFNRKTYELEEVFIQIVKGVEHGR
jgi:ABC-2 type transport system ATP-binding protein